MSYQYRCSRCRGRNVLPRALEDYKRAPKCRHCQYTHFYVDKGRVNRKDFCRCSGYHYTHRIKSPFCEHNPNYEFLVRTLRYREDPATVIADISRRGEELPPAARAYLETLPLLADQPEGVAA